MFDAKSLGVLTSTAAGPLSGNQAPAGFANGFGIEILAQASRPRAAVGKQASNKTIFGAAIMVGARTTSFSISLISVLYR